MSILKTFFRNINDYQNYETIVAKSVNNERQYDFKKIIFLIKIIEDFINFEKSFDQIILIILK